ncbi:hypothetical protein J1N35_040848, partial [Gossypium stocksii]
MDIEPHDLKDNFQQEIVVRALSEVLGDVKGTPDSSEASVEELPYFLDIVEEISHQGPLEDFSQERSIQIKVKDSKEVELVILKLMISWM